MLGDLISQSRVSLGRVLAPVLALTAALALAAPVALAPAPVAARAAPDSFADLAEGLLDAVVNISTSQTVQGSRGVPIPNVPPGSPFEEFFEEFFNRDQEQENRPRRVSSLGSGFVIDPAGIIVTNNHVIAEADEIVVNFSDGSKLTAEVIGRDPKTDLAVLRVEPDRPLTAVGFGDSDGLRVGDWVMAIGNPFGLGGTVTAGIVSAMNRDINAGSYDDFIQTDASINRGNSGGPLFNMDGEVVGINTAIISPSGGSIGIGFAIPTSLARSVIDQLVEFGETRRGWLGVRIQEVTDEIAETLGMSRPRGALIAGVTPDSPAADSGVETGDIVLSFDGREVSEFRRLSRIVADTPVGKTVDMVILRRGAEETLKVTIGRLEDNEERAALATPEAEPEEPAAAAFGLTLSAITDELREQYGIDEGVDGVVVTAVEEGSAGAEKQISEGDVLVEVQQRKVAEPKDVLDEIETLKGKGRESALVLVASPRGELRFVVLAFDE